MSTGEVRAGLNAAIAGGDRGLAAADRLCRACVDLLDVDGAAVSLVHEGDMHGTFGSDAARSRELNELQFTLGEGPGLDAARDAAPVLVPDLNARWEDRWPAFTSAVLESGTRSVFALPVAVANWQIGALSLFRDAAGPLGPEAFGSGQLAAHLAALPLLDVLSPQPAGVGTDADGWQELAVLSRVEVSQATGMILAQLGVTSAEALVRLRAYAFSVGLPLNEVAWQVVERRLRLDDDAGWDGPVAPERGRSQ